MPPKSKPRRPPPSLDDFKRPTVPAPGSSVKKLPKKPRFFDEMPTGNTNENASRWRMISRDLVELQNPEKDIVGLHILHVVARALAEMPPVDGLSLLQDYDVMGERQKHALAAISHSLVTTKDL